MKRKINLALAFMAFVLIVGFNACTPKPGKIVFWVDADLGCGVIDVTINGTTKSITSYYSGSTPSCDDAGCATFELAPGSYNWTAACTGSTWSGTSTVTTEGCFKMQLTP